MTIGKDLAAAVTEQHGDYNRPGAGVKADQGKLQWHLMPFKYFTGMVRVLMYGAKKYAPHNWRKGMPYSQTYNALQRHLSDWMDGIENDPETGESHLDHALCCLMFLRAHAMERPELDDRYKPLAKELPSE